MEKEVMEVRDKKKEALFIQGFGGFLTPLIFIHADLTPPALWSTQCCGYSPDALVMHCSWLDTEETSSGVVISFS